MAVAADEASYSGYGGHGYGGYGKREAEPGYGGYVYDKCGYVG